MESLKKYVPFIDYVLKIDREKYIKFINIRKWIIQKKKYPISDLNKIEQSIITQYKNLLLENNVQIPQNITIIFAPMNFKQFVNLCSDDEEDEAEHKGNIECSVKKTSKMLKNNRRHSNTNQICSEPKRVDDSDDDLEIVRIDYVDKRDKKVETNISKVEAKEEVEIDQVSKDILSKIDKFAEDDIKMNSLVHESINYTYTENEHSDSTEDKEVIYQRRAASSDTLFKRRADFNHDEVEVQSLCNEIDSILYTKAQIETISLDSDCDEEACNGNERPSILSVVTLKSTDNAEVTLNANEKLVDSKSSNSIDNKITNKNVEGMDFLCSSIQSVTEDINNLLDEVENVNESTTNLSDQQIQKEMKDKENIVQPRCENDSNTRNTPDLSPEQISKILEDISSKTDFELETLYEALTCVRQMNSSSPKTKIAENNSGQGSPSPPPAPPPIRNNLPTPSVQPSYPPQQQLPPPLPHYYQNSNFVPLTGTAPPRRKININDPRIKKELQAIQNSPLFKYNVLNADMEASIKKICEAQQLQQTQPRQQVKFQTSTAYSNKNNIPCCKTSNNNYKSSISYGEYKRRQLQKKLEIEKKREEERRAKDEAQRNRETLECSKNTEEEIRSKLLSTLKPCKEQLTTLWSQQKNLARSSCKNNNSNMENSIEMGATSEEINNEGPNSDKEKKQKMISTKKLKQSKKEKVGNSSQNNNADRKLNRVYNELQCSVKGFDQIQDYITNIAAKSIEKSNCFQTDQDPQTTKFTPRNIGLKRRSSIHALSAISEQLGQQMSDCSDSELNEQNNSKRYTPGSSVNSSTENLSEVLVAKRRKTIEEIIKPNKRATSLRILDDNSSSVESSDDDEVIKKFTKEPVIKLRRLTQDFIRKHTKRLKENNETQNLVGDLSSRLKKTCERVQMSKEPSKKMPKLKKYNNDCQMTERNTAFCVLCRSKPSDLTNHYIGRHKTESYVARLDWSELEDLAINTPFAKLQTKTKSCRFNRYEVECPFCNEKLIDQFINLYNHYSAHTGEYAFRCSHCHHSKPYRPDIQSHILHSKTCRHSSIQVMYRYPPQAQCIYLHYCTICNFTQLNEANVLKHLREHHAPPKAVSSNVQKCILAAMSDEPDTNESNISPSLTSTPPLVQHERISAVSANLISREETAAIITEIKFKIDDDNVPVGNEPCLEDEFLEEGKYTLEEQLKQLHERPSVSKTVKPMTVVHCIGNNLNPTAVQRHVPIIVKTEDMDTENKLTMTPPISLQHNTKEPQINSSVLKNYTVYEKYRSYPQNVNYLGLYKCMIDDCYYSTDCSEQICNHLIEHYAAELKPSECLQCPYCVIAMDIPITPTQLVEHVRSQHGHLNYQCSMCCYRSCDASNVHIHQQVHHNSALNACKIYRCSSDDLLTNKKQNLDIDKLIAMNIFKISCKMCYIGFYHTELLINHLEKEHKFNNLNELKIYSCIYCPLTVENMNQIRIHLATKHPRELPLIYDHNKRKDIINEDSKSNANVVNISESVEWIEMKPTVCASSEENLSQDVKPNIKELLHMNEETVKIRLQKLTAHTGIQPDKLYRCPDIQCGGFFSIFDLWLRHMKVRHHTLESQCPHCQPGILLPLEQFALHFEQHRRHTYICFHCSTTSPTEILANQHAAQRHNDWGTMRFEKVRFNLSYSYSVMIQSELFKERENFIAEFQVIVDNRLKDLENNEIKNLKHQWLVRDNTPWIDDYLQNLSKRKVARRCLVKDCKFRTLREDNLYRHLSTLHTIHGTQFNCSKCDYHIEKCNNLDELFNHIKLHNESIFICGACSLSTSGRSKMSSHIEEQHSARDVPVVHLFRTNQEPYIKIYIVFSENQMTFSTMKNCFCCSELNMGGDVFTLHLKRYHKLSLNYYCEKCTNFSLKSLNEVRPHFEQIHNSIKYKIRCELAGLNNLSVTSLNDFEIKIDKPDLAPEQTSSLLHIKNEPSEESDSDNVILLEDDDIVIQNSLRDEQLRPTQELPKLKCTSLSKLMEPPTSTSTVSSLSSPSTSFPSKSLIDKQLKPTQELPKLKCTSLSKLMAPPTNTLTAPSLSSSALFQSHFPSNFLSGEQLKTTLELPKLKCTSLSNLMEPPTVASTAPEMFQSHFSSNNPGFRQFSSASSLPAASATVQKNHNLVPLIRNTNISTTNSPYLNSLTGLVYNNSIISSDQPQNGSLPHEHNPTIINNYNHHVPKMLYVGGPTYDMQTPVYNYISTNRPVVIRQAYDDMPTQNTQNSGLNAFPQ